jgi:hypothetical protein
MILVLQGTNTDLFELLERLQNSRLDDQRCVLPSYFTQVSQTTFSLLQLRKRVLLVLELGVMLTILCWPQPNPNQLIPTASCHCQSDKIAHSSPPPYILRLWSPKPNFLSPTNRGYDSYDDVICSRCHVASPHTNAMNSFPAFSNTK